MRAAIPLYGFRKHGAPGHGQPIPAIPRPYAASVDPASHRLPARRVPRGIPGSRRSGAALLGALPGIVLLALGLLPLLGAVSAPASTAAPERVATAGVAHQVDADENAQEFIGRIAGRIMLAALPGIVILTDAGARPRFVPDDAPACRMESPAPPARRPRRLTLRPLAVPATVVAESHPSRAPPARSGSGG